MEPFVLHRVLFQVREANLTFCGWVARIPQFDGFVIAKRTESDLETYRVVRVTYLPIVETEGYETLYFGAVALIQLQRYPSDSAELVYDL